MKQCDYFGTAKWLCAGIYSGETTTKPDEGGLPHFPILRGRFTVNGAKKAILRVIGLGFFHCYLNGKEITEDAFLPLNTDYEPRKNYPTEEILTGHRIYVPEYDVTNLLHDGENVIAIHFGGGWYTFDWARFGDPKVIYRLTAETENGTVDIVSSEADRIGDSFVKTYHLMSFETQDYSDWDDAAISPDFDDSTWKNAQAAKPLDTEYLSSDCPPDRLQREWMPKVLFQSDEKTVYDCGQNLTGYPYFRLKAKKGEKITVYFSEEKNPDNTEDMKYNYGQMYSVISDGKERVVQPMFSWYGFRYFAVVGNAEVLGVRMIHTNAGVTSDFSCDNETLNWLYRAYVNTQLSNMHAGIPSDCPHLERRGYTGDGQLTCHAAMDILDGEAFYRKWIADIGDCQDVLTGHVQYTAPYTKCGGGPGGWGCAIVEVPYMFYKHYGDVEPMKALYPQMLRYFDYLEAHSVDHLVASDKAGEWCLGDWCAPVCVILPASFVNNYFYIKSLNRMKEIAVIIGKEADIPDFDRRIEERRAAVTAAFFNTWDGNFFGSLEGANAFAVDMGVGDERTYRNLVEYYKKLGRFDTGIFGTDIVTRVLFEHGDGELAASLLMATDLISFDGMRMAGSTTIWEYWPEEHGDRSHNHPMFGAVTAYLFDYLLGIRAKDGDAGYHDLVIAPVLVSKLQHAEGKRTLPAGEISVSYWKNRETADFTVVIPENVTAVFRYGEEEKNLHAGENYLTVSI